MTMLEVWTLALRHGGTATLHADAAGVRLDGRQWTWDEARAVVLWLAGAVDCWAPLDPLPPGPSAVPGAHNYIGPGDLRRTNAPPE